MSRQMTRRAWLLSDAPQTRNQARLGAIYQGWLTFRGNKLAMFGLVILILLIVPSLVNQAGQLINLAPQIAQNLRDFLIERFPDVVDQDSVLRQSLDQIGKTIQDRGAELVDAVLSSAMGIVNIALLFVIVPVVTF